MDLSEASRAEHQSEFKKKAEMTYRIPITVLFSNPISDSEDDCVCEEAHVSQGADGKVRVFFFSNGPIYTLPSGRSLEKDCEMDGLHHTDTQFLEFVSSVC